MTGVTTSVPLVPLEGIYAYAAARGRSDSDEDHSKQIGGRTHSPNVTGNSAAISLLSDSSSSQHDEPKGPFALWFSGTKARFKPVTRKLPEGWRFGVTLGAILSSVTLIINATVVGVAYSWMKRNDYTEGKIPPVFTGHCDKANRYSTGVHLAINVLSSMLLGASNYCMQCLSAPTRKNIDKAHRTGKWLDIGVQSMKNLRFIGPKKLFFWICLAVSSIPLHLVYNSTFFVSTTSNYYDVYITAPTFSTGSPYLATFDHSSPVTIQRPGNTLQTLTLALGSGVDPASIQQRAPSFQRLSPPSCIAAYAQQILAQRRTVILVTADATPACTNPAADAVDDPASKTDGVRVCAGKSSLYRAFSVTVAPVAVSGDEDWFPWVCDGVRYDAAGDNCGNHYREVNASDWRVEGWRVAYCLSEELEDQCSVHVAVDLLLVVVAFNAVKVLVLVAVAATVRDEPLITVGDAVASFVGRPDGGTRGMGLVTKRDVEKREGRGRFDLGGGGMPARAYDAVAPRRWRAASKSRWVVLSFLMFFAIAAVLGLLGFAVHTLNYLYGRGDAKSIQEFGLGKLTPYTVILGWAIPSSGDAAVIATVLIVNLPQTLLSFLYLLVNGVFTCMALASEWNRYGFKRRALRVSRPCGKQRTTYFLQVPYRMGVPLLLASMLLHWLISQSIFIAKIQVADKHGEAQTDTNTSPTTAAYSPLGMVLTSVLGACVMASAVVLGATRLKPGIPLASSCSVAIAAACHAPEGSSEKASLMWGVVPPGSINVGGDGVGHCAFSEGKVDPPVVGEMYL